MQIRPFLSLSLFSAAAFLLASCAQAPLEPLTKAQAQEILSDIEVPSSIIKLEKEFQTLDEDATPADQFTPNFNVSEKCEAVGRVDQLVYQSGWGTANKQALPSSLRGFNVREGVKFSIETPDSADSYEYVTLHASLLSFSDAEAATEFMDSISSNVEACGDMTGESDTFTLTDFSFVGDDGTDFLYEYIEFWELSLSSFSIDLKTFEVVAMYNMGANVLAIAGSISEKGSSVHGVTSEDLVSASAEIRDAVEAAMVAKQ
jgi:hypothetical protein